MLDCPRCRVRMEARRTQPMGVEHAVTIDVCGQCRGLWLDKGEAELVCPYFGFMDRRHVEIAALGLQGGGIAKCPRCGRMPHAFKLLDVELDYCTGCSGVWLEHAAYEGRMRPDAGVQTEGGPYRGVRSAAADGLTDCANCGRRQDLRATFMSARGLLCRECHVNELGHAQELRAAEEQRPVGNLVERLVELFYRE